MADKDITLRVAEAKQRDVGRGKVRLDSMAMSKIGVSTGDIVEIVGKRSTTAVAWPSYPEDLKKEIVRCDGVIRRNAGVSLGDKVVVKKAKVSVARQVTLAPEQMSVNIDFSFENFVKRKLLGQPLSRKDTVLIPILGRAIPFNVVSTVPSGIVVVTEGTQLKVAEKPLVEGEKTAPSISYEDIGGLHQEILKIREMVELPLKFPQLFEKLGIDPPKGVLLHGPPGCGKTLIARAVANESEAHFIVINGPEIMSKFYGESEQRLRSIFKDADENSPSIVFIDELDAIAPKREDVTGEVERRVVAQLLALMDGMVGRGQVIVIGATNRPNAVDPALRRPGRFDREIEIHVPDRDSREEIMLIHTRGMPLAPDVELKSLADVTHGYVGADLEALSREAAMKTLRRVLPSVNLEEESIPADILDNLEVTHDDFVQARKEITPTAIREVFIESPDIPWEDVGGLKSVINEIREAIEWPLTNPEAFKRIGIKPPRGILLYGPPGCGKTLLAKAVATESDANFISVKGPEVLSKWVGESEKAIREVFRKARMASPSIVFFDEIDSLTPRRGMSSDSNVTERVISQLLTELDGLVELKDIVVIAATNRPDIVDPALLRPGRFDRLINIDAPNQKGRLEILKIYTRNMPLDSTVVLKELASSTEGFVGSDIEALCREAGMIALRTDFEVEKITMEHFKEALQKVYPTVTPDVVKYYQKIEEKFKQPSHMTSPKIGYT
ncbi:MAG: CDC48 family AAA ATPase [Candidatus Heimdallarchaeaceae archaeon]